MEEGEDASPGGMKVRILIREAKNEKKIIS